MFFNVNIFYDVYINVKTYIFYLQYIVTFGMPYITKKLRWCYISCFLHHSQRSFRKLDLYPSGGVRIRMKMRCPLFLLVILNMRFRP